MNLSLLGLIKRFLKLIIRPRKKQERSKGALVFHLDDVVFYNGAKHTVLIISKWNYNDFQELTICDSQGRQMKSEALM